MPGFLSQPTRQLVLVCAFLTSIPLDRPHAAGAELLAEAPVPAKEAAPRRDRWTLKQAGKQRECTSKMARSVAKAVSSQCAARVSRRGKNHGAPRRLESRKRYLEA